MGRPLRNLLNHLHIGLRSRRKGSLGVRLIGHHHGSRLNRLQCRLRNHPYDSIWDDHRVDLWDELADHSAIPYQRHGSRPGARVTLKAVGRSIVHASAMPIASPPGCSLADSATHSWCLSSAGLARGSLPSHFNSLPDHSLAMLLDVAEAGVPVCSPPCFLSG